MRNAGFCKRLTYHIVNRDLDVLRALAQQRRKEVYKCVCVRGTHQPSLDLTARAPWFYPDPYCGGTRNRSAVLGFVCREFAASAIA